MILACSSCRAKLDVPNDFTGPSVTCARCGGATGVPGRGSAAMGPGAELHRTCPSCGAKYPTTSPACPECGTSYRAARAALEEGKRSRGAFAPERAGWNAGVLGGVVMLAIAAGWFFLGLQAGRIFFYPPILAVIGVVGIVRGLATGNLAGGRRRKGRTRGR
jgi:hypothetical protein